MGKKDLNQQGVSTSPAMLQVALLRELLQEYKEKDERRETEIRHLIAELATTQERLRHLEPQKDEPFIIPQR